MADLPLFGILTITVAMFIGYGRMLYGFEAKTYTYNVCEEIKIQISHYQGQN